MFGVSVIDVLKVNNVLSVACERIGKGSFAVGMSLTDGSRVFEIAGIPFVRYCTVEAMEKNICLELKHNDYNENELVGKTLYAV